MAVILASGTTAAGSTDVVVAAGTPATVFLSDAAGDAVALASVALIQIKAANNEYYTIGELNRDNGWCLSISSPGTYRVYRPLSATAFAVEQV